MKRPAKSTMPARIASARRHAGLTQTELARVVGVVPSAVAQWEGRSGTSPTVANLARVAVSTKHSFEWLATGRGEPAMSVAEVPAVVPDAFAHDADEERVLALIRSVSRRRRPAVLAEFERIVARESKTRA